MHPFKFSQHNYRQELPAVQLCRYCFYALTDFSVFRPQGRQDAPIKVEFGREERFLLPNITLIGSGVWAYTAPKL